MDGESTIAIQWTWTWGGRSECSPAARCLPSKPSPGTHSHEALIFIFSLVGPYACAPHAQLFISTQQCTTRCLTDFWVVARSTFPTSLTQEATRGGRRQVLPYEHHSGAEGWKAKGAFQKGTLLYLGSICVLTSSVPTGNCLSGFLTDENSLPSQL